jgi:hypothetical protein
MLGLYTPLLILQVFCIYHAYKNGVDQRWYWLILLFPLGGSLIYLYHNFANRSTVQTLAEGVKEVVNSNYRTEQLEKALRFNDNITNKTNLADAYVKLARYREALELYKDCLSGFMAEDPDLRMKALQTAFLNRDFESVISYGEDLDREKTFKNSEARISFAWALHYQSKTQEAQKVFEDMNKSFTNYRHRIEYGKFLKETNQLEQLKNILTDLSEEFNHMKGTERRTYRGVMQEARDLYSHQ